MKAKLKINEISRAVKLCVNALNTRDTLMNNIQFEAEDGCLQMTSTNGTYSIAVSCPCEVEEEGSAIVDGKMAYNCIAKGVNDCIITSDDRSMTIKTIGRTKIPTIDHDIPTVKDVKGKEARFNAIAFKNAINCIGYAISEDQSRVVLTGAHIVSDGYKTTITALDGFRLSQTSITSEGEPIDIIVPSRVLFAICDAITDGELTITSNGSGISVVGDSFKINAVTLSGDYIDVSKILPTNFSTNVIVKTADIKACADSATVASGSSNLVKFQIGNDNVAVMSNANDADFLGNVNAMTEGNELTIAFNLKYIIQAFSHINTDECELRFNASVSPAVIVPHNGDTDDVHLILPVRTFG